MCLTPWEQGLPLFPDTRLGEGLPFCFGAKQEEAELSSELGTHLVAAPSHLLQMHQLSSRDLCLSLKSGLCVSRSATAWHLGILGELPFPRELPLW